MITIGFILVIVGIIGSIWSRTTRPGMGDYFDYAFTGGSAFKIHAYRFFNGYGIIVIVAGIILLIWGYCRKNKKNGFSVGSLGHKNDNSTENSASENLQMSDDVKLVLDPETREIKWICSNCGHVNSCDDMICANCQHKR